MTNIELKASYKNLEAAHEIANAIGAIFQWTDEQIDTYYQVAKGRLKLRQCNRNNTELIAYNRFNMQGVKRSDYQIYKLPDINNMKKVLECVLSQEVVIHKVRSLYMWDNVRIHLDRVQQLGMFIEFEAIVDKKSTTKNAKEKVQKLIDAFNIQPSDFINVGYADMLIKWT